ncbi:MAG TPA: hypothetical protein VJV79_38920 [Polyangiaceae bacterium]|nr:hypothetical protein [Polyangiaceae bacterium]
MATTFSKLPISAASFATLRVGLTNGIGFFSDGPYTYVAADSAAYRIDVVRRSSNITWTDTVRALPKAFKAVINGGYFSGPKGLYVTAVAGTVDPVTVTSNGDVKSGGSVVLPDNGEGKDYFFFGHDGANPPKYLAGGPSNPSASVAEGMGGLGPMILPNAATGTPLKFGVGNKYLSDPKKLTPPTSAAELTDCIQRNNNTYASIQAEAARGTGFCATAVVPSAQLVLLIIKRNNTPGDLDRLRDSLFGAGCTLACFTDGASSTCLAVDGEMEPGMEPQFIKDNLIETGFGLFLYKLPPPTNIQVTFTQVKIFNDAFTFGAGEWTLNADVNGTGVNLLAAEVDTGDLISMNTSATVTVAPGAELLITTSGQDTAGVDDDLGTASVRFGAAQSPAFGLGRHVLSTPFYAVSFTIGLAP